MLFGLAEPTYNGTPVSQLTLVHTAGQNPQTTINRRMPITIRGTLFRSNLMVTQVPNHVISWNVEMPPDPVNGGWEASGVPGRVLRERLEQINTRRLRDGLLVTDGMKPETYARYFRKDARMTLRFEPAPSPEVFMAHVYNHELQHVADHRWLAKTIIGRWDDVLMKMLNEHITLLGRESDATDISGLGTLFGYATSGARIPIYWKICAIDSGELFHETDAGAIPEARIVQITESTATVRIQPRQLITEAPDLVNPTPHQPLAVKGQNIDGIELHLLAGNPAPFTKGIDRYHLSYYRPRP
jgi:hypothetical protein